MNKNLCHHLLALMSFQIYITFVEHKIKYFEKYFSVFLGHTKEDNDTVYIFTLPIKQL